MNITLTDERRGSFETDWLCDLASDALRAEGLSEEALLGLTLVTEERMAELHAGALGMTEATDVLAFPLENMTPGETPAWTEQDPPPHLGDVVICPSAVRRNAKKAGVPFDDELALMVIHGVLHLLGYDHAEDAEAEAMEGRERDLLAAAGMVRP